MAKALKWLVTGEGRKQYEWQYNSPEWLYHATGNAALVFLALTTVWAIRALCW